MIERFFRDPRVVARLRVTSLGGGLDDLSRYLYSRDYAQASGQSYLRGAGHFSYWLGEEGTAVSDIDEETVGRFLGDHLAHCRCPVPRGLPLKDLRASMRHLLTVLRDSGRTPPQTLPPEAAADVFVQDFLEHLRDIQGVKESTCLRYGPHVHEFLRAHFGTGSVELTRITAKGVMTYVQQKAVGWRPKTVKLLATSLRGFFKFMQVNGLCDPRLASAVPTIPEWKLGSVPKIVSDADLGALLASFQPSAIGRRDRAMCLCLCRMALRAGEVAALGLDDIDWRAGVLCLGGKSRRTSVLPLPSDVGRAIVDYLRLGRPQTPSRRVFVQHCLPIGVEIDTGSVRAAIRRGFERAGLKVRSKGTHVLRHTAATNMLRGGATLKEVADVLRHRSVDTTAIYAKVDLPRLKEVAMPWPEVRS
jgi:site-specific recombinase XerD